MCSLEVPDIQPSIADHYTCNEDVEIWLVNTGDTYENALTFATEAGVEVPVLLDSEGTVYGSYDRADLGPASAPFPLQLVIDRSGTRQEEQEGDHGGSLLRRTPTTPATLYSASRASMVSRTRSAS